MKRCRLGRGLQRHGVLGDAGCAEIVGDAADRDHQRVVADGPWRGDLAPLVIEGGGEMHFLGGAIEPDHLAQTIAEPVPMRLGEVVQLVLAGVQAARRDFVQQRLPKMCPGTFHQGDTRPPAPAEAVAEPGDELEPRRTAADHDDLVQALVVRRPFGRVTTSRVIGPKVACTGLDAGHDPLMSMRVVGQVADAFVTPAPHLFRNRLVRGTSSATVVQARIDGREQTEGRPVELGPAASHHRDEVVVDEARSRHRHSGALGFGQCEPQILDGERRSHSGGL